jgi:hypothetical protein
MQLAKLKKGGTFYPINYINALMGDGKTLKYFVYGEGYKKTKAFELLEADLPDERSVVSWLEVAKIYDQYGINVANLYAERKTAGIVSKQTAIGKGEMYRAIKGELATIEDFDPQFFDLITCNYMLSCFGVFIFDIVAFDERCAHSDKEYDNKNATYKGEPCSLEQYVQKKFGERYVKLIDALIALGGE